MKNKEYEKGVNLIALILTIIIIIILAAIGISMIIGNNEKTTQGDGNKNLTEQTGKDVEEGIGSSLGEIETSTGDTSFKLLVNSRDDRTVYAPVEFLNGTIDWGDGTKENYQNKSYPAHKYSNENQEYTIKIEGTATKNSVYFKNDEKIVKILDWGELGVKGVYFDYCINLAEIASPRENSLKNVTDFSWAFRGCANLTSIPEDLFANCPNATKFYKTFAYCTKLTNIPSNLFANCPKVTDFTETFYRCTSLTGNSIRLWEDTDREKYEITESTGGKGCYNECTNLNDYSTIPDYWKESTYSE